MRSRSGSPSTLIVAGDPLTCTNRFRLSVVAWSAVAK